MSSLTTIVAVFAAAGAAAGAGTRVLLGRMRRGAHVRAPVCELAVALLWAVPGGMWAAGALPGGWLPVLLALGWLGVAAGVVDLRHHRLPDALTLPAVPVALVMLTPLGSDAVLRGLAGGAVATAAHALPHLVAPRAMGAGDVKLAASLGVVLTAASWAAPVLAVVLAAAATGLAGGFGALFSVLRSRPPPAGLPHGPSMLLATWVVLTGTVVG